MAGSGYSGGRFRAALLHYVLGRGANALASVALFVLLARVLDVRSYGAYVAVWALLELLLALGNAGSEWITATELPRLRQARDWSALRALLRRVLGLQLLSFGALGLLLALLGPWLAELLGLPLAAGLWAWIGLHLLVEGLGRSLRDQFLSSLLLQWLGQTVQLLRNLAVIAGLLWAASEQRAGLDFVLPLEALASAAAMLLAGLNLLWQLRHREPAAEAVAPPDWQSLRRMARHAWLGTAGALLLSPQLLLLIAARFIGAEALALLGFARNLAEQVRRFMPIEFGFMILRTYLVAARRAQPEPAMLVHRGQVAWKANALVLLPLWLLALVWGGELAAWVGGERYAAAGPALLAWLSWVLVWSHHRLVDTWAHLLARSAVVGRNSLLLALAPALLALALSQSALAAVYLLALLELVYVLRVGSGALAGLQAYPWRQLRAGRWLLALGASLLAALALARAGLAWPLGAALSLLVWALLIWRSAAFGADDLRRWRQGGEAC